MTIARWIEAPVGEDPIFARTRYTYDSYTDYWKLVELSKFPTCYVDEIDLEREATYIVSPINGELRPHVTYRRSILKGKQKAKIVWWNLERPDSHDRPLSVPSVKGPNDEILQYVDEIWVSDVFYRTFDPRMKFVVLGSHTGLQTTKISTKAYDFAVMAYLNPRRTGIISKMLSFRMGPNAWEPQRGEILATSRSMLNIHQTDAPIGEPLRFALAAAYKLPIISETCKDPYPLKQDVSILMSDYPFLADYAADRLRTGGIEQVGNTLHLELCFMNPFRRGVEQAIMAR